MNFYSKLEDEINRLQNELYMARSTILELMPLEVRQAFHEYENCKSRENAYQLRQLTIDKLIEIAGADPEKRMRDILNLGDRAYCPLCGGSARSTYGEEGFALPEGLKRHLEGSYNSQRCFVFEELRKFCIANIKAEEERQESLRIAEQRAIKSQRAKRSKSPPPLKSKD